MINAFDLIGIDSDNQQHRDWQVLAAHGLLKQGDSVWSSRVLSAPLSVPPTLNDSWDRERRVLHKAIECLNCGPKYQRVIFAGLSWTVAYLIDVLKNKLFPGFEWMWINPSDPPQQWLLSHGEFGLTTGNWVKSGFDELIYSFHFERYLNWLTVSCLGHSQLATDISAGTILQRRTYSQAFNRRIYEDAGAVLSSSTRNFEMVERYHKSTDPFSPSLVASGYYFPS